MAGDDPTLASSASTVSTASYETALCVIPPQDQCLGIESLRSLYDKAYEKWPPHINLIYPFVAPELLSRASLQIEKQFKTNGEDLKHPRIVLDRGGYFEHRNNNTIFLCESVEPSESALATLRNTALRALGHEPSSCNFHLTIGQSEDETASTREFLLSKANLLPALSFDVASLVILVREQSAGSSGRMRLWGSIDLPSPQPSSGIPIPEFWLRGENARNFETESGEDDSGDQQASSSPRQVQMGTTYSFNFETNLWSPAPYSTQVESSLSILRVSSYNVLIDSEYPPARDRDEALLTTILSDAAIAEILVLQEVSDDFLSYLLSNDQFRQRYKYVSHGPPNQANLGPLPSLRNVVIAASSHFRWEFVPFHRRHKGAVVGTFPSITQGGLPLVVAGVHLTCGLTDGSVAAKKIQLNNLTSYLRRQYASNPWVVAGDFNLTTSKYTIEQAARNKAISQQTLKTLEDIETHISYVGLLDTWAVARVEGVDNSEHVDVNDLYEGEEGATFNPRENLLAAITSGTSNNRPQRYDRILKSHGHFSVKRFNHFGLPKTDDGITTVPSDHSGIRAVFGIQGDTKPQASDIDLLARYPVENFSASASLSLPNDLYEALARYSVFPTVEEEQKYANAFALMKEIMIGSQNDQDSIASEIPMVMVPVGSYALGVWTAASDIDCLVIGSISSKTFFRLAIQRIYKAQSRGVRLLRKVKANTGTMLEMSVLGVHMDLQYCPAAGVVQRWEEFPNLPSSDSIFSLPIHSLRKLKPIRDLVYIQRTMPSMAAFRLAYHSIKLWAAERGIYSAKFGYLGGIHITLLLAWVCKRLAHSAGNVSAGDLIVTFFHHYAHFDWKNEMVFDAFFHKKVPRYQRSAREPMVILGYHAPSNNIAHTATAPGLQVIVDELKRASDRLASPEITWDSFFSKDASISNGATDFLTAYDRFVKIEIQYWGRTLHKGKGLVGWVESRCINLVVDIHKALPDLNVRIWPARFANNEASNAETYYHGCYLIGLSRTHNEDVSTHKEHRSQARVAIEKTFERFLSQVKADERYFDESSCWVGVSLAKPSDLKDFTPDEREWGDDSEEIEPDSDDEDEAADAEETEPATVRKLPHRRASPAASQAPVSASKLRPASDVLARLRWDPNLDPSEYIVGYEDRFLGAKETSLERWKTEQTDEEFIPQHRILYFKKRGEGGGEVVWERRTRIDKVFGSGVGDGSGAAQGR